MRSRRSRANCRPPWACHCRDSVLPMWRDTPSAGLVARISDSTVWRWLHEDAIRPWQHRCWIFPRDPQFQPKAGRILDLYARCWQGRSLREDEFVISTDEKTSIQARLRIHPSLPRPGKPMRVEHEYTRGGAWAYLAALDVHRAKVFGRCEATTGIAPFERLVDQVMRQPPYDAARRVFWIMDNGSSHRGADRCNASRKPIHDWFRCTDQSMRAGSTRSRSTSRSCSARCSHPMTSLAWRPWPSGWQLRAVLREHRSSIRVEVHPRRPQRPDRSNAGTLLAESAPENGGLNNTWANF